MVELVNSRWMHVAMAMAALTTGCAVGEAGAEDMDMDEAEVEAVEVEETSQALYGVPSRNCGGSWGRGPGWGGGWGGGWPGTKFSPIFDGWGSGSGPWSPWGGNNWGPYGGYGNFGNFGGLNNPYYSPFSGLGSAGAFVPASGGCGGYGRPF